VIDGKTRKKISDYGALSVKVNAFFHEYVKEYHIPTSFDHTTHNSGLKFSPTEPLPIYIKILNTSTRDFSRIFSTDLNSPLTVPVFEHFLDEDADYPLNEHHVISFNILPLADFKMMGRIATKVNVILKSFFERRNLLLSEMTCTFGKSGDKVVLLGQFSPHTIKLLPKDEPQKEFEVSTPSSIRKYLELFQESVKH